MIDLSVDITSAVQRGGAQEAGHRMERSDAFGE